MKLRWLALGLVTLMCLLFVRPALSYLTNYTRAGATPFPDKWGAPPVWHLNPQHNSNIQGGRSVDDVMQAAFATWAAAPGTVVRADRGANVSSTDKGFDGENLVCFICSGDFSEEPETLAVTITTTTTQAGVPDGRGGQTQFVGQILDSDILFNPARSFHTDSGAGEDLQTVAIHEIGHFFGLNHSGVVRATMFPYSPSSLRTLSYDDVAAISVKYPLFVGAGGTISGTVRLNGSGVFGAHVFAESQTVADPWRAANIRKSPISTLTQPDGTYRIEGLPPDAYVITAEPLDLPVVNDDVDDFGEAFGRSVQTGFTTRWH